jgi:DNA-binding beta-propeller fold protein YncE
MVRRAIVNLTLGLVFFLNKPVLSRATEQDTVRLRFIAVIGDEGDKPGQFRLPQAVSTDNKGNLYVTDTGNNRVQKFDAQGRFVDMIGGFGWEQEQFQRPMDVCADNGLDVFVADFENRRIVRCDNQLHWISTFTIREAADERLQLGFPASVSISIHSDLFIVDSENRRVLKLNSLWQPELSFGNYDWGEGGLTDPASVYVARDDRVYVSDRQAGRVSVYDYFGTFLQQIGEGILKRPAGLCEDQQGRIWVADGERQQVVAFSRSGRLLLQWGSAGSKLGAMQNPADVAVHQNRLYVADRDNHRIELFEIE